MRAYTQNIRVYAQNMQAYTQNMRTYAQNMQAYAQNMRAYTQNLIRISPITPFKLRLEERRLQFCNKHVKGYIKVGELVISKIFPPPSKKILRKANCGNILTQKNIMFFFIE